MALQYWPDRSSAEGPAISRSVVRGPSCNLFAYSSRSIRGDGLYPVNAGRLLTLVVLCHPSHGEGPRRLGFHQEPLQAVDGRDIAPAGGFVDALLQAVHMLLQLAPRHLCPVFDWLIGNHRFRYVLATRPSTLHVTGPTSAYLRHYPEPLLLRPSLPGGRAVRVPARRFDHLARAASRVISFRRTVVCCRRLPLSAGFV